MDYWRKIYEKMTEWELYKKDGCVHMFIHLLLRAASEDGEIQTIRGKSGSPVTMKVLRGQYFTSIATLSRETGMSVQTVRRTLSNIAANKAITHQTTKQGTLITITNFERYQNKRITSNIESNKETNIESNKETNTLLYRDNKQIEKNIIRKDNNEDKNSLAIKAISARARQQPQGHTTPEHLMRHWNWAIATYDTNPETPINIKPVEYMTPEREERLRPIVEIFTVEDIRQGVKSIMLSKYCNGRTEDRAGKIADFDWVFQSVEHFTKVVEGRYR